MRFLFLLFCEALDAATRNQTTIVAGSFEKIYYVYLLDICR